MEYNLNRDSKTNTYYKPTKKWVYLIKTNLPTLVLVYVAFRSSWRESELHLNDFN